MRCYCWWCIISFVCCTSYSSTVTSEQCNRARVILTTQTFHTIRHTQLFALTHGHSPSLISPLTVTQLTTHHHSLLLTILHHYSPSFIATRHPSSPLTITHHTPSLISLLPLLRTTKPACNTNKVTEVNARAPPREQ